MSQTTGRVNIDPLYPVGSTLYSGAPNTGQWPQGGQGASNDSGAPSLSNAGNPDYWLPIWSGEVLHAYDEYNSFEPLVVTETIQSGTTKRFPITGTVGITPVWNAGVELLGESGTTSTPGWFDISLDSRPMASHFELDDIHLMLTQWDYRAEIARQAGLQLANARDKQIACMIAQGAFTPARSPFGTKLSGMNEGTDKILPPDATFNDLGNRNSTEPRRASAALLLLEYIERYMVHLQEVNVDTQNAYLAVTPQAFHDIRTLGVPRGVAVGPTGSTTGITDAFTVDRFGAGGYKPYMTPGGASGMGGPLTNGMTKIVDTLEYMGCTIMKSNHLLTQDVHATTAGALVIGDAKYNFAWDTLKVKAIMWQRNAICSLRLQGMKVESIKDVRRGTNFTVASIMAGAGILRPELCGAICGV